jgi:type VI secretion system secreted protein VgrG
MGCSDAYFQTGFEVRAVDSDTVILAQLLAGAQSSGPGGGSIKPGEGTFGPKGDKLMKDIEELHLKPYDDSTRKEITEWNENATIGWGHLISKKQWDKYKNGITACEAETLFYSDLAPAVKAVNKGLTVNVTQNQFDALVMLAFNIGIYEDGFAGSSVLKMINDPNAKTDYSSLESAWKAWDGPGDVSIPGLVNRRVCEWKIYSKGIYERW